MDTIWIKIIAIIIIGTVVSIGMTIFTNWLYNISLQKHSIEQISDNFFNQTDAEAIQSDWQAVGDDLRKVISDLENITGKFE
jgi:hypothetical protein